MNTPDHSNWFFRRRYEIGSFCLVFLNLFVAYAAGVRGGYRGAELAGYSTGPLALAAVIFGVSRLIKSARTTEASRRIIFFTLLVLLPGSLFSITPGTLPPISTEIEHESLVVDEQQAKTLALRIQDSVSQGETARLNDLYDEDRFMKKALRGRDTTSRYVRDLARGASDAFKKGQLLEQMASLVKEGAEFAFVKLYRKDQETILQFRVSDASGLLHYVDLYLFTAGGGKIRIDDLQYHNQGELLSRQVIENAMGLSDESDSHAPGFDTLQEALQLKQQGQMERAYAMLGSLPDEMKQQKMVMRMRMQWAYQVDAERVDQLFEEFRKMFPDDPGIAFSAYTVALFRDDPGTAASLIDDIYKAVGGDEYLLWHKADLLLMQKKYREAAVLLSEMENKYKIDVISHAGDTLDNDFLSSKEYRAWLGQHKKTK